MDVGVEGTRPRRQVGSGGLGLVVPGGLSDFACV